MRNLLFLFFFCTSYSFSQAIDYNIKKRFVANGYDVVAYFNNEAIEGAKKFVFEFDGVSYKFISKKNLMIFKESPKKYIPQYGGYCAYAVAKKSDKVSINPKTFAIINDKLYLFYNAWGTNTLELWRKRNVQDLLEKADNNWGLIKFLKK